MSGANEAIVKKYLKALKRANPGTDLKIEMIRKNWYRVGPFEMRLDRMVECIKILERRAKIPLK